jgi:PEP-CTERM motif
VVKSTKAFLFAGASALAILASAAEANAETFTIPGHASFIASMTGVYVVEVLGAGGGNATLQGTLGARGAEVSGDIFLTAGELLPLFVGGQGLSGTAGGGGGGGSFVFDGTDVLAVAGGGGGAAFTRGGPGQAGKSGQAGAGPTAGAGGVGGNGGGAGIFLTGGGGGGSGVNGGLSGIGGNGFEAGIIGGSGGFMRIGGLGAGKGTVGGNAAGLDGGGGRSGYSGGGGGGGTFQIRGAGGGGGGSYLASLFTDPDLITGGGSRGNGSISIVAVPEPSTWAMMLAGFAGLGWLAHTRRRKTSPA